MCRTGGRRCPGRNDSRHRAIENARRRVTRNTAKAAAARTAGDTGAADKYDALAANAQEDVVNLGDSLAEHVSAPAQTSDAPHPAEHGPQTPDPRQASPDHPAAAIANAAPTPTTFPFMRRTEGAEYFGKRFGQDIEPSGRYLLEGTPLASMADLYETGQITFTAPLHMDAGGGYEEASNWKQRLSKHYDGKTGAALSQAVADDGYDGIVTSDEYGTGEIVDLTHLSAPAETDREAGEAPPVEKLSEGAPSTGPTWKTVKETRDGLERRYPGVDLTLTESPSGYVVLNKIAVPKDRRSSGVGSKVMHDLIDEADKNGWPLALTPDTSFGASSKSRLERFYKRFGFVSNRGRKRDFETSESMVRQPQ